MKFEINLIPQVLDIEHTYALVFDDQSDRLKGQYSMSIVKRDKEDKVVKTTPVGTVNKRDITRLAKAT